MAGIVNMITGGDKPKVPAVQTGPTAAELAEKDAKLAKDAAAAAGDYSALNADRRRAAAGSATTLLTGTGLTEEVKLKKPGLTLKSTLGGGI